MSDIPSFLFTEIRTLKKHFDPQNLNNKNNKKKKHGALRSPKSFLFKTKKACMSALQLTENRYEKITTAKHIGAT